MNYSFDPAKQALNVKRHGLFFTEAQEFEWESALIVLDDRRNYGETRFTATGLIGNRVCVMVFHLRETSVRLISLRKANRREVMRYANQI